MPTGKHTDFTGVVAYDEGGTYEIMRVDPAEHKCESCMGPAEYRLRSDWDMLGQCEVDQCQHCLLEAQHQVDTPTEYVIKS